MLFAALGEAGRPEELPSLVLAYIGDAVYELGVRAHLVQAGLVKVDKLHSESVKYVNAGAQAKIIKALEGILTREEAAVARRGRNAKTAHVPRSAGVIEYRHSTALESLIGYLYLKGDGDRLYQIITLALQVVSENNR